MDMKTKNIHGYDWTEETTEERAPHPVMEKPENPLKFILEYVSALLGATSAIVLFYVVLKVV